MRTFFAECGECRKEFSSISFKRAFSAFSVVQSKGRAVSRLMESFAADEGFHLGEDSSFSDEDEERKVSSNGRFAPGEQLFNKTSIKKWILRKTVRYSIFIIMGDWWCFP